MILIFDYDGTLHDTASLYGFAVRCVLGELAEIGYASQKESSDKALSKYLGMTAHQMWEDFMPGLSDRLQKNAIERVGYLMCEGILEGRASLYEGIPTLLSDLKKEGHDLVILSNCQQSYMDAHRTFFSLDRWFTAYYCSGAYQEVPKEVLFENIRKEFSGNYVMIGDRASDIKVGMVHRIPTIACSYGYGNIEEWQKADYIANSVQELRECLRRLST